MKHSLEIHTLPNGFRVAFVNVQNVDTVTVHLKGLAGSNYESAQQIGCAHLIEHLSLQGPVSKSLNKLTSLGCKYYGVTSRDTVLYMCKGLSDNTEQMVRTLFEVFSNISFSDAQLENTKNIAVSEHLRRIEYPEKLLGMKIYESLFLNHRITGFNTGDEKQISSVTLENCIDFKKHHYIPQNFVLVVSGNFDKNKVTDKINKTFGKLKSGTSKTPSAINLTEVRSPNIVKPKRIAGIKSRQFHIMLGWTTEALNSYTEVDYQICSALLEQRLVDSLKIKLGLSYTASSSFFNSQNYGIFGIYASCSPENADKMVSELFKIVKNQSLSKIEPKVLKSIKNIIKSEYIFNFEKVSGLAEFYSESVLTNSKSYDIDELMLLIDKFNAKKAEDTFTKLFSQKPKIIYISNSILNIK